MNVTDYVRPVHPGILVIPPGNTQHESTILTADHKQRVLDFCETVDVEKAVIKQVVHQYLDTLRNRTTVCIDAPIVTI